MRPPSPAYARHLPPLPSPVLGPQESEAWRPWYVKKGEGKPPAGYVTSYTVPSAPGKDFGAGPQRGLRTPGGE